ncbi:hypothetical protein L2E82_31535 [Cichorium intybus]|uniref:Uncharacterized protein n=1 Tax=Cichorium intybus TaxID=13427 RepID=A0ACB9BF18_CICIN|nr:hypothetical protein L2E82_31535 [Cichorium intybus]
MLCFYPIRIHDSRVELNYEVAILLFFWTNSRLSRIYNLIPRLKMNMLSQKSIGSRFLEFSLFRYKVFTSIYHAFRLHRSRFSTFSISVILLLFRPALPSIGSGSTSDCLLDRLHHHMTVNWIGFTAAICSPPGSSFSRPTRIKNRLPAPPLRPAPLVRYKIRLVCLDLIAIS